MSQKKIIIAFILLFIASSFWLFYQSEKQSDPNSGKTWWSLYYKTPIDNSLNFSIENHSDKTNFHWELLDGVSKIQEDDTIIPKGETGNVMFQDLNLDSFKDKKISIKVSADGEVKEIYKNL